MKEKELSRRQRMTIRMLQEAYIELLQEQDAEEITIVTLCERADINRTTFYRYFTDLKAFSHEMVADLFGQVFSILGEASDQTQSPRKKILRALNITIKNKKLLKHLLSDASTPLAEQLLEDNLTLIRGETMGTGCKPEEGELCYAYFCGGLARLWVKWIEEGCKTPKEKVALIIEELITWYYRMMGSGFILSDC